MKVKEILLSFLGILLSFNFVFSQDIQDSTLSFKIQKEIDSLGLDSFNNAFTQRYKNHFSRYTKSKQLTNSRRKLADLEHFEERLSNFLKFNFDTSDILTAIYKAEHSRLTAISTIYSNQKFASYRDLTSSQNFLREITNSLQTTKIKVNLKLEKINVYQAEFDSLVMDSTFFEEFQDNRVNQTTKGDIFDLNDRLMNGYFLLVKMADDYQTIKARANLLLEKIENDISEIKSKRHLLALHFFDREVEGILKPLDDNENFGQVLKQAYLKEKELLFYYFLNIWPQLLTYLVIMWIVISLFKQIVSGLKSNGGAETFINNVVFTYPTLSFIFIFLMIGQFIFFYAPFVFQGLLWFGAWLICIWFIANHQKPFHVNRLFVLFLFLFPIILFENLVLDYYPYEFWVLALTCLAILVLPIIDWFKRARFLNGKRKYLFIVTTFSSLIFLALVGIFFGRYNFAKTLLITGYLGMFAAVLLFWLKDVWYLFLEIPIGKTDSFFQNKVYYNLKNFSKKSTLLVDLLIYVSITIVFLRNFFLYNILVEELTNEIVRERIIGKYVFTLSSIFTFFLILIGTLIISRLISFFFDDQFFSKQGKSSKGGIKNWTLVFKLIVLICGFLLAFIAAGVPMNNLTIVIGSLGLGIGFGLQNIVSHLLSGIIIAFEKPFEVNDQVEWNGMLGRITEIGLRSCKILNADGSEVVVPNTDLLNQKLINWTHSNNLRRLDMSFGLGYGTDLNFAKETVEEVLNQNKLIKKFPKSQVLLNVFGNSSVECRILFWVEIEDMFQARSELVLAIHAKFSENNIKIPYPQLDIHFDKETASVKEV